MPTADAAVANLDQAPDRGRAGGPVSSSIVDLAPCACRRRPASGLWPLGTARSTQAIAPLVAGTRTAGRPGVHRARRGGSTQPRSSTTIWSARARAWSRCCSTITTAGPCPRGSGRAPGRPPGGDDRREPERELVGDQQATARITSARASVEHALLAARQRPRRSAAAARAGSGTGRRPGRGPRGARKRHRTAAGTAASGSPRP